MIDPVVPHLLPNGQLLSRGFACLSCGLGGDRGALAEFASLLATDARLWLPPTPNTKSPYEGRTVIHALLSDFIVPLYRDGLRLDLYRTLGGPSRCAFLFEDQAIKRDGSVYQNSPCIVLEARGDQIASICEYWGGPHFFADSLQRATLQSPNPESSRIAQAAFNDLRHGLAGDTDSLERFLGRLAPDVSLWFPPTPNTRSPYRGAAAARALFVELLVPMYPQGLYVQLFHTLSSGSLTTFETQSFGVRRDGSEYINTPALTLNIRDGKIGKLWEHWGPPGAFDPELRRISI